MSPAAISFDQGDTATGTGAIDFPTDTGSAGNVLFNEAYPGLSDTLVKGQAELLLDNSPNASPKRFKLLPPAPGTSGVLFKLSDLVRVNAVLGKTEAVTTNKSVDYTLTIEYPVNPAGPIEVTPKLTVVRGKP